MYSLVVSAKSWQQAFFSGLNGRSLLYAFFYLLIALGIWLRIDYISQFNPLDHIWSDPQRHWEQGTEVLRNDPMAMTDPILYQLYIAVLGKLTLKDPLLIAFYTSLLSILTPWIWYRFARELQPSRLVATGLWAALSLLPSWITIYAYFMQETLLLPLLGAALYATWRCKRKQTAASFLLMVLMWILAGLTRGITIPLAAVACSWLWFVQPHKIRKALYSLLALGLILGPLGYRAYQNMHLFAPHGIGQLVAIYTHSGKREIHIAYQRGGARWNYWFGSPSTGEQPLAPLSDWRSARTGRAQVDIDIDKGGEDWSKALTANPLTMDNYFWLTKENLIFLYFGASWPDKNLQRLLDRLNYHGRWLWAPLTLGVLLCSLLYWRRMRDQRLLCGLLLTWILVQGFIPISVNEGRYRKPGEGLLLAQAALLLAMRRRRAEDVATDKPDLFAVLPLTLTGLALCVAAQQLWLLVQHNGKFNADGLMYLSDMRALAHKQEWGRFGRDKSVEQTTLNISGKTFAKGLGVHASSETRYKIPQGAEYFHSYYGLDQLARRGRVEFRVLLDNKPAYASGSLVYPSSGEIWLPVTDAGELTLLVDSLGNNTHDHASWAEAAFFDHQPAAQQAALSREQAGD